MPKGKGRNFRRERPLPRRFRSVHSGDDETTTIALPFHVDAQREEERGAETEDVGSERRKARSSVVDG